MRIGWSQIQLKRLRELDADREERKASFSSPNQRDRSFQELESSLIKIRRKELRDYQKDCPRPRISLMEERLTDVLVQNGFFQVVTPTMLSKGLLAKMSITEDHPLYDKIFWLDGNRCLRPMLAPNLYYLLKDLLRIWEKPVRLFEIGSCFRKETHGAQHAIEFTMLNLVDMGLPAECCHERLEELIQLIMEPAEIHRYKLVEQDSEVYGRTIDVMGPLPIREKRKKGGRSDKEGENSTLELGSSAIGPHRLDYAWGITEPWVGVGIGLERLLMSSENSDNVARWGRSLVYLDGKRLNI